MTDPDDSDRRPDEDDARPDDARLTPPPLPGREPQSGDARVDLAAAANAVPERLRHGRQGPRRRWTLERMRRRWSHIQWVFTVARVALAIGMGCACICAVVSLFVALAHLGDDNKVAALYALTGASCVLALFVNYAFFLVLGYVRTWAQREHEAAERNVIASETPGGET